MCLSLVATFCSSTKSAKVLFLTLEMTFPLLFLCFYNVCYKKQSPRQQRSMGNCRASYWSCTENNIISFSNQKPFSLVSADSPFQF